MPTIRDSRSVAANSTVYPLQGSQYEFMSQNAKVEFAVIAAATGILASIFSGSDVLQQAAPATVKTTPAMYPEDFLVEDVAAAGERISCEIRNTTGGAIVVETIVRITPVF